MFEMLMLKQQNQSLYNISTLYKNCGIWKIVYNWFAEFSM